MAYDWAALDQHLRWRARKGVQLQPKLVHEITAKDGIWQVLGKRGTKAAGNKDVIAEIRQPSGSTRSVEALKDLVSDVVDKAEAERTWMKSAFLPSLVEVVALGKTPVVALPESPDLPGMPASILLNALQVVALTESRRYGYREPFGGRYLLVRVCVGMVWGVWQPEEITWGRLMKDTVASLRAETGVREPPLGMVLAKANPDARYELGAMDLEVLCL